METPKGFAVADAHVDLESVDNFVINANFDSDKAQYRKIHAEISNKPAVKLGKSILITVTSDGQNIVTGRYYIIATTTIVDVSTKISDLNTHFASTKIPRLSYG